MSKVIKAVATLLRATYLDATPDSDTEDAWRDLAADARAEWDAAQARIADLERELAAERERAEKAEAWSYVAVRNAALILEANARAEAAEARAQKAEADLQSAKEATAYVATRAQAEIDREKARAAARYQWSTDDYRQIVEENGEMRDCLREDDKHFDILEARIAALAEGLREALDGPLAKIGDYEDGWLDDVARWKAILASGPGEAASTSVLLAARAWWESRRPLAYTEAEHRANPAVNTTSAAEKRLARAVAALPGEAAAELAGLRELLLYLLVGGSPWCEHEVDFSECGNLATKGSDERYDCMPARVWCDEHGAEDATEEFAWAAAVRKAGGK